jgi:hypothetical protein
MRAGVSACDFRSFEVERGQLRCPGEHFAVWHDLRDHSPFVRRTRSQRLWIQQERLRPPRSGAVTPGGEASPGTMPPAKCGFPGYNHIGKQGLLGVHIGRPFDGRDYRHADVR